MNRFSISVFRPEETAQEDGYQTVDGAGLAYQTSDAGLGREARAYQSSDTAPEQHPTRTEARVLQTQLPAPQALQSAPFSPETLQTTPGSPETRSLQTQPPASPHAAPTRRLAPLAD